MPQVISLAEAAQSIGVSRRRMNALANNGQIHGERLGPMWVFQPDEVRRCSRLLQGHRGQPLSQREAWDRIRNRPFNLGAAGLDEHRRRLTRRAKLVSWYVHPGLLDRFRSDQRILFGGADRAAAADLPIDPGDRLHIYLSDAEVEAFVADYRPRPANLGGANVIAHVVNQDVWVGLDGQLPLIVAWLDLEDDGDRSARLVFEAAVR